jgi:hypothetical protein
VPLGLAKPFEPDLAPKTGFLCSNKKSPLEMTSSKRLPFILLPKVLFARKS